MKNKKLKGFTLVELLVVIAILAVLATVSVVGYTSFITKANNSNALTECKQAEDIVLSDLISAGKDLAAEKKIKIDGSDTNYISCVYSVGHGKVQMTWKGTIGERVDITDALVEACSDIGELKGKFYTGKTNEIYYLTENEKGIAVWRSGSSPITPDNFNADNFKDSTKPLPVVETSAPEEETEG